MREVTVQKEELLEVLKQNRDAHRDLFNRALEAYRDQAVGLLEDRINRIRDGKVEHVYVSLPVPEDHTSDYNRVIRMVEMSINDELTLSEREFAAYVQDDWDWKQQFLRSTESYLE